MAGRKVAELALVASRVLEIYAAGGGYLEAAAELKLPREPETRRKLNAAALLDWAVAQVMPPHLVRQARNIELERLQIMHRAVWEAAAAGNHAAIAVVQRLMDHRDKLLGLYAPVLVEVDDKRTADELSDAELGAIAVAGQRRGRGNGAAAPAGGEDEPPSIH